MKVWLPTIRGRSGTDVFTRRLAEALPRYGAEAHVTWISSAWELLPSPLRLLAPPRDTDVVHANSWNGFAFSRPGLPLVVTCHLNVHDPDYRPYRSVAQAAYHEIFVKRREQASFDRATRISAVGESTRRSMERAFRITKPMSVIPTWVNTAVFFPRRKPANRSSAAPFRLLFAGNPTIRKGGDLLVPIMERLGDGFELYCTAGLRDLKVDRYHPSIKYVGRVSNEQQMADLYNACDALLFPSRLEGFSLVVLEAMACGIGIVATRTPTMSDLVRDGETGLLCTQDDVQAFVDACRRLREDRALLSRLGECARDEAAHRYSEQVVVPEYVRLYEQALADVRRVASSRVREQHSAHD